MRPDGSFHITNVPAGDYYVSAMLCAAAGPNAVPARRIRAGHGEWRRGVAHGPDEHGSHDLRARRGGRHAAGADRRTGRGEPAGPGARDGPAVFRRRVRAGFTGGDGPTSGTVRPDGTFTLSGVRGPVQFLQRRARRLESGQARGDRRQRPADRAVRHRTDGRPRRGDDLRHRRDPGQSWWTTRTNRWQVPRFSPCRRTLTSGTPGRPSFAPAARHPGRAPAARRSPRRSRRDDGRGTRPSAIGATLPVGAAAARPLPGGGFADGGSRTGPTAPRRTAAGIRNHVTVEAGPDGGGEGQGDQVRGSLAAKPGAGRSETGYNVRFT